MSKLHKGIIIGSIFGLLLWLLLWRWVCVSTSLCEDLEELASPHAHAGVA